MYKIIFLLAFVFVGCNKSKIPRSIDFSKDRDFRIVNVFNESKYNDFANRLPKNIEPDAVLDEDYTAYSYLSLRPDKSYTFLLGNQFMYGTYQVLNKDEIILQSKDYGNIPLKIIDENKKAIQIHGNFKDFKSDFMLEIDGNTKYYLNLMADFEPLSKENDIRSLAFNQWRFRPVEQEDDAAIKKRLLQNLRYIAAYMRVHLYGDFDQINIAGIHSPFLHAKNGLFLYEWNRVSYFWKNIFFDAKDAEKAYKLMNRAFNESESPEFIDNWLAYNEACMEKLIETIEKME